MHTPPKIRDLDFAVDADENVLGLNVAVDDVLLVQVLERGRHLSDVLCSLPFRETLLAAQVLVQLAFSRKLKDQEDAFSIVEVAV